MKRGTTAILFLLIALPYLAGLRHGFVFDDHGSIEENSFLSEPGALARVLSLRTIADRTVHDGGRPVVILSYMLDRAVWGLRPFGFHLTNLLLHLLACGLLFALARRVATDASSFLPIAAALLFGLHPALTEAVQVPAFREDILVTIFLLLALLAGTCSGRRAWPALPALALALMSKESGVAGPFLLAWLWMCFPAFRPPRGRAWFLAGAGLALCAIFVVLWSLGAPLQAASSDWAALGIPFPSNLFTAPWLWFKALRVLIAPIALRADYVVTPAASIFTLRFALGALAVATASAFAWRLRRNAPAAALGLGWMLVAFVPVSNLVPLFNPFAERYLYLPAAGFALALATAASLLPAAHRGRVLALVCAVYAALTICRVADWRDDATVWSRTLEQEPRSARARTWVALELKARGRTEEAMRQFVQADLMRPADVTALINIGVLHGEAGRYPEAEAAFREAIRRSPSKADAYWNLAAALNWMGRTEDAAEYVRRARELDPRHPRAREMISGQPVFQ